MGKLAFAHADVPVVARLRADADAAAGNMLEALLQKLRGSIQLPECLRVIGYLRRLAVYNEQVCGFFASCERVRLAVHKALCCNRCCR